MQIIIDKNDFNTLPHKAYRGAGMVSANNSSRLLLDYKSEHPEKYNELLEHMFGKNGVAITHLKIEMGSDINSSSGTEPAIMRSPNEKPDITRGAGFLLAADAKKVNPELTLDMLYWSEPRWVSDANDVYAARYKWYKANLDAAYETYGLKFDYVSANCNERALEPEWIKYLSEHLKRETDCPYDYSAIKIVAADEVGTWEIAKHMLEDEELMNAVDVVGSHYTSHADDNARLLSDKYGKELWFSEGSAPMGYPKGSYRYDGTGTGLSGLNGILDIASRIISMYPDGCMTLYEYQPVISSYYDGVTYSCKQLITANEPWSGYYSLDSGFYMSLHFSRFIKKGWHFVDGACNADGEPGGDGHCIVNAVYTYMTVADPETGDYSTVIVNTTDSEISYDFAVKGLDKESSPVYVWETKGPDNGRYDENYFRKTDTIVPVMAENGKGDSYGYSVTVKPYSLVTVTTVDGANSINAVSPNFENHTALACSASSSAIGNFENHTDNLDNINEIDNKVNTAYINNGISLGGISEILRLPYYDDFEYYKYPQNYLSSRGFTPRYTTDEGGAFEVRQLNNKNVLMQIITPETKAREWGYTPEPTSNFGDDRWFNYSMSCDVYLKKSNAPENNYAGIGIRYNLADIGSSGYSFILFENGLWRLRKNIDNLIEGHYYETIQTHNSEPLSSQNFNNTEEYLPKVTLTISANYGNVKCFINGNIVAEYDAVSSGDAICSAGRAALYSSYNNNCFDNVAILPENPEEESYEYKLNKNASYFVTRFDNTDTCFEYDGKWEHNTMSSFKHYNRTISTGRKWASLCFKFTGTGFAFCGQNENKQEINGSIVQSLLGKSTRVECSNSNDNSCVQLCIDGKVVNENLAVLYSGFREITILKNSLEYGEHIVELKILSGTFSIDSALIF